MRRISCSRLILFSIAGAIVQIIGLSLFVFGFFPIKPALSGFSGPESFSLPVCDYVENQSDPSMPPDQLRLLYQDLSGVPPLFDRLVFMVIDGLPAEFVLGKDGKPPSLKMKEAMPYTQSLLASGLAIGYHAKAAPPTVTMPRLKAMVSGAIGGFLDVAFNFNTQALLDDNLIVKFSRIGWKMVMFGDETWLKLFPGVFTRHDGVSSFFVKDTIKVDHNVTRHLGNELSRDDWNLMILHYLGLDHVGHVGGRNSALMPPKLTEMDEVIKRIHSSIYQKEKDGGSTLLMVVSDHGMTKSGNHGGSSDEETDSLILLIGTGIHTSDYESSSHNFANQVDIAPTLALLLGVPIPSNNVGVLISAAFDTLADQHRLRVLELNSWQLLRLLRAQLPALPCSDFPCHLGELQISDSSYCNQSIESTVCCLYAKATLLHASWRSKNNSDVSKKDDYRSTAAAYDRFLRSSSEWLSRRTTDKPVNLLAVGLAMMSLSCLIFIILILHMRDVYLELRPQGFKSVSMDRWSLEEAFILFVILIVVASMGSSSMVEEEHYIWHFMLSTFYLLLLRKAALSFPVGGTRSNLIKKKSTDPYFQLSLIFLLLITERILRGWHQGGVNWVNLPDISKWLDTAASGTINSLQLISALLVIGFGLLTLFLMQSSRKLLRVKLSFSISGLLVLLHIVKYQDDTFASSSYGATLLAQIIYTMLGASTVGTSVLLPWLTPSVCRMSTNKKILTQHSVPECTGKVFAVTELRDSLRLIGLAYILCWSFLQLLLQQPKNSSPILLLFVQIYVSMLYFSRAGSQNYHQEWKEVAALHYLGIAGHFALGNSNTLATIDVAGAFIGISSHSTLLSGILMFIITYASPMFVLLSLVLYISMKITDNPEDLKNADGGIILSRILGYTCLVPLGINSVLLTAYTVILLLMRNHLFVWSVFSPKYLYVCAATFCTYVGVFIVAATGIYTHSVLALRWRRTCKSKKLR